MTKTVDLSSPALGVTPLDVRLMREATGNSMPSCYLQLRLDALRIGISEADNIDDLRNAMMRILDILAPGN